MRLVLLVLASVQAELIFSGYAEGDFQNRAVRVFNNGCRTQNLDQHFLKIFGNKNNALAFNPVALPTMKLMKGESILICDERLPKSAGFSCNVTVVLTFNGDDTIQLMSGQIVTRDVTRNGEQKQQKFVILNDGHRDVGGRAANEVLEVSPWDKKTNWTSYQLDQIGPINKTDSSTHVKDRTCERLEGSNKEGGCIASNSCWPSAWDCSLAKNKMPENKLQSVCGTVFGARECTHISCDYSSLILKVKHNRLEEYGNVHRCKTNGKCNDPRQCQCKCRCFDETAGEEWVKSLYDEPLYDLSNRTEFERGNHQPIF